MKYIICAPSGQLGNQIYMVLFLKKIASEKSNIFMLGCHQLNNLFNIEIKNIKFLNNKFKGAWRIPNILAALAKYKIIGSIDQKKTKYINGFSDYGLGYVINKGLLGVYYVRSGFYLSESFFDFEDSVLLKVKDEFLEKAKLQLSVVPKDKFPVFVHVRRGDYLKFSFNGLPAGAGVLPKSYYLSAFKEIEKNIPNCFYIFVSDDINYVEKEFKGNVNKIISSSTFEVDFAIMTLCRAGIIANSTFSIWGGYFAQNNNRDVLVYAPFNNLGYSYNIEIPEGIMTKRFSYIHS